MGLSEDLDRVAAAAHSFAEPAENLVAVIPAEPHAGVRVYLCAFARGDGARSWLALDHAAEPVSERRLLRDAVSIAAMCELAEETAGGGDLAELRSRLAALRETEEPDGIDDAEAAVVELEQAIGHPPRLATPTYLDEVGSATRRLERALAESARSPLAEAMKGASAAVEELTRDVEAGYKLPLE